MADLRFVTIALICVPRSPSNSRISQSPQAPCTATIALGWRDRSPVFKLVFINSLQIIALARVDWVGGRSVSALKSCASSSFSNHCAQRQYCGWCNASDNAKKWPSRLREQPNVPIQRQQRCLKRCAKALYVRCNGVVMLCLYGWLPVRRSKLPNADNKLCESLIFCNQICADYSIVDNLG